jgi:hypothetical protein
MDDGTTLNLDIIAEPIAINDNLILYGNTIGKLILFQVRPFQIKDRI